MNNEIALPQNNEIAGLSSLAQRINEANQNAHDSSKKAIYYAIECGDALINAKSLVKHGEWQSWLKNNCEVSERTAQNYMKLATEYPSIEDAKAQRVADLSIREAIKELSKPKEKPLTLDTDWMPKGETLAVIFVNGLIGNTLYLQESLVSPTFYYIAYEDVHTIDFTVKPIACKHVERIIFEWLPGKLTRNGVTQLNWSFLNCKPDYVKNEVIESFLPETHRHLRRTTA